MFCPKCGHEIKAGAAFCPKCGARQPGGGSSAGDSRVVSRPGGLSAVSRPKALPSGKIPGKALVAAAAAVVVVMAFFLFRPGRTAGTDAQDVVQEYFAEQMDYAGNQRLYEECLRYMVSDLSSQLASELGDALEEEGVPVTREEVSQAADAVGTALSSYFNDSSNQAALAKTVTSYAKVKAGKAKKKGGSMRVKVTVTGLDIRGVNALLIEDNASSEGLVKLASRFILSGAGGFFGNLGNAAAGDLSFVLDAFAQKASQAGSLEPCTGEVLLEYDKESEEWVVSEVEEGLKRAYFGLR